MPRKALVSDIMTRNVVTIDLFAPMSEVRKMLTGHKFHHLPVLDGDKLVGIISTNDLIRVMRSIPASNSDDMNDTLNNVTSIEETMQTDLFTMRDNENVERAIDLLASGEWHSLLIVDRDEALAGIVTNIDLLEYLFK